MRYTEIASLVLSASTGLIVLVNYLGGSTQRINTLVDRLERDTAANVQLNQALQERIYSISERVSVLEHAVANRKPQQH